MTLRERLEELILDDVLFCSSDEMQGECVKNVLSMRLKGAAPTLDAICEEYEPRQKVCTCMPGSRPEFCPAHGVKKEGDGE